MKRLLKAVIALVIIVIAYNVSGNWNEYYLGIADKRFDSWMSEGSWRGAMSQYNNARGGVLLEWLLGHAGIWLIGGLLFLAGVDLLNRGQPKQ